MLTGHNVLKTHSTMYPLYARIEASVKDLFPDAIGEKTRRSISHDLNIDLKEIRIRRVLSLLGEFSEAEVKKIGEELFYDLVVENLSFQANPIPAPFSHGVEVSFMSGVTDNVARSAREGIELLLSRKLLDTDFIFSSTVYLLNASQLPEEDLKKIIDQVLHNKLIEKVEVIDTSAYASGERFSPPEPPPALATPEVEVVNITTLNDEELLALSKKRCLVLNTPEMKVIRDHYSDPQVKAKREEIGLSAEPTDVEIETLAQTWSEHCKHKIFAAKIDYVNEKGEKEEVDSLFKTYISDPTTEMMKRRPDVASVFSDNAGVFHFDDDWDICIKAETHNSPSALDPYGGAMTGIVGVNRDVMGTGRGFLPIFNTDVFCFGPPDYDKELPERLHHPRRIFRGVHRGIVEGGNESGIPTVNGSISFDERFIGKPLVFCGTGGLAPRNLHGRPIHEKWIDPGDKVVTIGGLIGKDGIHGATFSSEELSETSPSSAVQIGDPITQKRMTDFLMEARDAGLYNFITDNGAGGLSSSLGEMAEECGGVDIDLSEAPLKYPGLAPWEIFLSEAQERMSLAVPPKNIETFLALAKKRHVTAVCLGEFTNSGNLNIFYGETQIAQLNMQFLHHGLPQMEIEGHWTPPKETRLTDAQIPELSQDLIEKVLSRFNICSKEDWVRQYDHEVQGMSVIKPFMGKNRDAPSDAAVLRPLAHSKKGLAVSHGLLPRYSDIDTYAMVANVMDEALRSLVAVGADPDQLIGIDNFCWPDPVESKNNPDGKFKAAQLVRACQALADYASIYTMPCISGKDSMKNDCLTEQGKISIPPTLLFTALSTLPDVHKSISMDFKNVGDIVFLLGQTKDELGASEFLESLGLKESTVPQVDGEKAIACYRRFFKAAKQGLVASAHDLSEGGLIVSLAESCFGGQLGVDLNQNYRQGEAGEILNSTRALFSESASRILVSVSPDLVERFTENFEEGDLTRLGQVSESYCIAIGEDQKFDLAKLYQAWRQPLGEKS